MLRASVGLGSVVMLLLAASLPVWAGEPAPPAAQASDEGEANNRMSAAERRVYLLQERAHAIALATEGRSPDARLAETYASVDAASQRLYPVQLDDRRRPERGDGTAIIFVRVDEHGNHDGAELVRGSGSAALDEAAVQATTRWRYTAASRDGVPVPGIVRIMVSLDEL